MEPVRLLTRDENQKQVTSLAAYVRLMVVLVYDLLERKLRRHVSSMHLPSNACTYYTQEAVSVHTLRRFPSPEESRRARSNQQMERKSQSDWETECLVRRVYSSRPPLEFVEE